MVLLNPYSIWNKLFIAIEGIDGSGKTTITRRLTSSLSDIGVKVFQTREPTDDLPENMIRKDFNNGFALFCLFMSDRFKHAETISQKISEGYTVISDRFLASSFAYQGPLIENVLGSFENAFEWMKRTSGPLKPLPDITFLLDIDPQIAMERIKNREKSPFEKLEYLAKVRKYYLATSLTNTVVIDALLPLEEKLSIMMQTVKSLLFMK